MKRYKLIYVIPFLFLFCAGGFSEEVIRKEITDVRVVPEAQQLVGPVLSTAERFGIVVSTQDSGEVMPGVGQPVSKSAFVPEKDIPAPSSIRWETPEHWQEASERPMRLATFIPKIRESVECGVSVLVGEAGGILPNLNRWRGQLGLSPLDESYMNSVGSMTVLGVEAVYMECTGIPAGVDNVPPDAYMLLGLVCPLEEYTLFVKMTGPAAEVTQEKEAFAAFIASFHFEEPVTQ